MTHRRRTILFFSLLILFLIIAPLTVFYCLGWRIDWKSGKIVQPGIFYFKVWPKNCQVFIDGSPQDKTDIFFGSLMIENLMPKEYSVEIKKEGFQSWQKNLEIKKGEVTEAKNLVLIPENPDFKILVNGVKEFFFSPDEQKIILKEEDEQENWSLKLFEIAQNVKSRLIDQKDISQSRADLLELKFSPDSKRVLLEIGLKERIVYYLLETDKTPLVLSSLDFLAGPEKIFFESGNEQKLLFLKDGKLSEADLKEKTISPSLLENLVACSIPDKNSYCLDNSGFLLKNNEKLNLLPLDLKKETEYEIKVLDSRIFLKESDILYLFNDGGESFQKLSDSVKGFKLSPDSQKLVYFNDNEIWVLFLEKKYDQPRKEANEKLFLTRFSEKIDNVFWYTDHYLIFNSGNKIKIAEIDDRDKINIWELTEFPQPEIFRSDKKLYLLSEENLYLSQELTP